MQRSGRQSRKTQYRSQSFGGLSGGRLAFEDAAFTVGAGCTRNEVHGAPTAHLRKRCHFFFTKPPRLGICTTAASNRSRPRKIRKKAVGTSSESQLTSFAACSDALHAIIRSCWIPICCSCGCSAHSPPDSSELRPGGP